MESKWLGGGGGWGCEIKGVAHAPMEFEAVHEVQERRVEKVTCARWWRGESVLEGPTSGAVSHTCWLDLALICPRPFSIMVPYQLVSSSQG